MGSGSARSGLVWSREFAARQGIHLIDRDRLTRWASRGISLHALPGLREHAKARQPHRDRIGPASPATGEAGPSLTSGNVVSSSGGDRTPGAQHAAR
jgi:hypothetical protein